MRAEDSSPDRVVFDTNVLISAYLWQGPPRKALELARSGRCQLVISNEALREFVRVLAYSKFGLTPREIAPILEDLMSIALFVPVRSRIAAIKADPTDNVFVGLAVDSGARYIVSGDRHLLDLRKYRSIEIITVARFIRRFI
ncbi:MAG: putative toxin-antitoxin system toxin component, PIN family [Nitrospirae bacterium]|nr:putative toxin-antitoxin system toxin component, PIN family [Nitrospirota bacterium]